MAAPATTVFDVGALPSCVSECGAIYDVNGFCVSNQPTNIGNCFCEDPKLQPFSRGPSGVCDNACAANPADLGSIQQWFTSFCGGPARAGATLGTQTNTATGQTGTTRSNSGGGGGGGGGGDWLSNHYQWVIFLVIMVVAIVGIWVGACIWRRRYLRKKDRQYALGTNLAHATESGRVVPNASQAGSIHRPGAGMFEPAPISAAGVYGEKPRKERKKWIVSERT